MGERIGAVLAPILNKLFIDNKGDIDLTIPSAGYDQHSQPRLLNTSAIRDEENGVFDATNKGNQGSGLLD